MILQKEKHIKSKNRLQEQLWELEQPQWENALKSLKKNVISILSIYSTKIFPNMGAE